MPKVERTVQYIEVKKINAIELQQELQKVKQYDPNKNIYDFTRFYNNMLIADG